MNSKRFSNGTLGHVVQTHICRLPLTRMITYRQMSLGGLEDKRLTKQILLSSGHETFLQKEQKGERRNVDAFLIFRTYSACKIISYYLKSKSQLVAAIRTMVSWVSVFSDADLAC